MSVYCQAPKSQKMKVWGHWRKPVLEVKTGSGRRGELKEQGSRSHLVSSFIHSCVHSALKTSVLDEGASGFKSNLAI